MYEGKSGQIIKRLCLLIIGAVEKFMLHIYFLIEIENSLDLDAISFTAVVPRK